jgi:hypothetical protein
LLDKNKLHSVLRKRKNLKMPSLLRYILSAKRHAIERLAAASVAHAKLFGLFACLLLGFYFVQQPDDLLLKTLQHHRRITDGSYRAGACRKWQFEKGTDDLLRAFSQHMFSVAQQAELSVLSANELGIEHCFLVVQDMFLVNPAAAAHGNQSAYTIRFPGLCKEPVPALSLRMSPTVTLSWRDRNRPLQQQFTNETAIRIQIQLALMNGLNACQK